MIAPRTFFALVLGKVASGMSRYLGVGGGTTFPGVLARWVAPDILHQLSQSLAQGVILVSGTNGKTTTTRMIADVLQADTRCVLHNRAGANLVSGLTTTAVLSSTVLGRVQADIGLFETDEAAFPEALAETCPRFVVVHNLFRDQLDRYGEVDTIAAAWKEALHMLPAMSTVVLNADDPAVAYLGDGLAAQVVYYGLDDPRHASGSALHTADSLFCRYCGHRYTYSLVFYAHVGHYVCPACGHRRPTPHIRLVRLDVDGANGSHLYITFPSGAIDMRLPLPGVYNALNALAAVAASITLGVEPVRIRTALENFHAAFGRIERVQAGVGGPSLLIALIKNPVGASETVRMLIDSVKECERGLWLLVIINDLYADGTDVSWLWDADFEPMASCLAAVVVSGTRAADMAVRLKYAMVPEDRIRVTPNVPAALDNALEMLPADTTLFVLPTYTAMLEVREELARRGWVRPFWES